MIDQCVRCSDVITVHRVKMEATDLILICDIITASILIYLRLNDCKQSSKLTSVWDLAFLQT